MKKKLSYKVSTFIVLSGTAFCLFVFMLVIYCMDPLMQYHLPWFHMNMIISNSWNDETSSKTMETYYNPGIAANADYDSALVGSSMVECADTSWFDEAFHCNTEKLTISGITIKENVLLFRNIFKNREVKNIFLSIDTSNFTVDTELDKRFPMYLWDDKPLNDVNYLLNKYLMFKNVIIMYEYNKYGNWNENGTNEAYKWGVDEKPFDTAVFETIRQIQKGKELPKNYYIEICDNNMNQITPFIEAHPETKFYISLPPYSILKWYSMELEGTLDATLAAEKYGVEKLLAYDNVHITSLQGREDIITDLNLYCDASHHNTSVNQMIIDSMKAGNDRVTKDNYQEEIDKIKLLVEKTNYAAWLGEN